MQKLVKRLLYINLLSIVFIAGSSCNKLIDIPSSKNQIETNQVFSDSTSAKAALLNVYVTLSNQVHPGMKYIGLYTDEYTYTTTDPASVQFNQSRLNADNSANGALWNGLYFAIYQCNELIEQVDLSTQIPLNAKNLLKAEARFLRAFSYFYLINLYDHVPLLLSTDVNRNSRAIQSSPEAIYSQITNDLIDAKTRLQANYDGPGKVRANKWAAAAMLARIYLYQGKWAEAQNQADEVIATNTYEPLTVTANVFLANSTEAILQLWTPNGFISDATSLIPANTTRIPAYVLSSELYLLFETTDLRKTKWTGTNRNTVSGVTTTYIYPAKYRNRVANASQAEYIMVLRLSELHLIRAEAHAHQGNLELAVLDINKIRLRSESPPLLGNQTELSCLEAIAIERQKELFGEWGHRFFDLKRNRKLDEILGPLKNTWKEDTAKSFPIPTTEILYNPNLKQNYGY